MEQKVTETSTATTPVQSVATVETITSTDAPIVKPNNAYQKKKVIFRMHQIIWYLVALIEILLAFRIILKALGANSGSSFVNLIYSISSPFAMPFAGIFGTTVTQGSVFEWSTLVAGVVYLLLGFGLVKLMQLVKPANPQEVIQTVDNV